MTESLERQTGISLTGPDTFNSALTVILQERMSRYGGPKADIDGDSCMCMMFKRLLDGA